MTTQSKQDHPRSSRRGAQHHRRAAAHRSSRRAPARDARVSARRAPRTLGDLEAELAEYDALHDATLIEATGIEQLPTALIRARIACGLTQRQLAERVGLQEQAIQRYEATDYSGVSFARLVEIAGALDLTIHCDVRLTQAS